MGVDRIGVRDKTDLREGDGAGWVGCSCAEQRNSQRGVYDGGSESFYTMGWVTALMWWFRFSCFALVRSNRNLSLVYRSDASYLCPLFDSCVCATPHIHLFAGVCTQQRLIIVPLVLFRSTKHTQPPPRLLPHGQGLQNTHTHTLNTYFEV